MAAAHLQIVIISICICTTVQDSSVHMHKRAKIHDGCINVVIVIAVLFALCNAESSTAVNLAMECSSDGSSLHDTSGCELQDLLTANQNATHTTYGVGSLPNSHDQQPIVVRKRGRGRPPMYNLSDKRKAQLREVCLLVWYGLFCTGLRYVSCLLVCVLVQTMTDLVLD